jgi:2'-5' RNA ligase
MDLLFSGTSPVVGQWYERTSAAIDGMPPHVTLLWPWRPAPVTAADLDTVAEVVAGVRRFSISFQRCGAFTGALYLAPEPDHLLYELMHHLAARFQTPHRIEASSGRPCPHMTVAKSESQDVLAKIRATLEAELSERPLIVQATSHGNTNGCHIAPTMRGEHPKPCWRAEHHSENSAGKPHKPGP